MRILYVKQNSERAREFQLKTVIYEIDGQKYVKKQAMTPEAIPHLKKMKESYAKITASILTPAIKLAKIIDETEDSLTFEFIEGISLEHKYNEAKKHGDAKEIEAQYMSLQQTGFKTTIFDSKTMVTNAFKETLGDFDYSECDGDLCFEGISNIDLIFSNIIYKGETIYLIDYEWVYDFNIPIDFSAFRALHSFNELHWKMEKHFVFERVVGKTGFLNLQAQYTHKRFNVLEHIDIKNEHIKNLDLVIRDKENIIKDKDLHIKTQTIVNNKALEDKDLHIKTQAIVNKKALEDKDLHIKTQAKALEDKDLHIKTQAKALEDKEVHIINQTTQIESQEKCIVEQYKHISQLQGDIEHWHNIARDMTIKNRLKKGLKKILPSPLVGLLKTTKNTLRPQPSVKEETPIQEPTSVAEETPIQEPTSVAIDNPYCYIEPLYTKSIQSEIKVFKKQPLISIIMPVYNVDTKWLKLAIDSIESQWYKNWELCIADDKSTKEETISFLKELNHPKIKITFIEKNLNISGASNEALKLTSGEYIVLMDNDDEITPNALYEMVKALNETDAEFIYSDEDKIEMDGSFSDPHFKPDFAPDMFLSQNYLSHLGMIKKELITKVSGFTLGLEGSQDFDLYLKILEHTDKIYHISKVLYHWRKIPGSTAAEYGDKSYAQEAGRKALENAMQRRDIPATVKNGQTPGTYKVDYLIEGNPLISIVIPFKDKPELMKVCIESILEKSTYQNFEIIGISNNSIEEATFEEIKYLESLDTRVKFHEYNVPFNYSEINNHAVNTYAKGEHILLLNNDIEIITPTWIEEMLMYSQQAQNGAIGAKLYFPNDTIQHAGLVMAPLTIHSVILVYQGYPREHTGYGARLTCVNNYSAVTAACLMVKRRIYDELTGLDAQKLSVAYNDVDFCLRIQEAGYHNVWTPYCEAYHHESISRGYEVSRESVERREKEKYHLKEKHPDIFIHTDPYYNKNLTRFSLSSGLNISVKKEHEDIEGVPFSEEIIITKTMHTQKSNKVAIFSHFDAHNEIKPYVVYYLKELSKIADILFISTAEGLEESSLETISPYCKDIIVKKNYGYDFGSWKTGLNYLGDTIDMYKTLILCNDSAFGPLVPLENIFQQMNGYDLWTMSDNMEISYHLQSYFMVYSKKAFNATVFKHFWNNFKIYRDKQTLIEHNEIGYSQQLINSGLKYGAYYSVKEHQNYVNVLQYYWDDLVTKHQFPFIKKEVLTTNPLQLDTSNWEEVIHSVSTYNTNLIKSVLK